MTANTRWVSGRSGLRSKIAQAASASFLLPWAPRRQGQRIRALLASCHDENTVDYSLHDSNGENYRIFKVF
jgi:hypothetical protein